jgi:phosphatidylethanolamine N-methyltransferase
VLFLTGQLFVITSTWALGITGTFLGDYFGILMDARVEGFPFNVLRDPMYVGSTMCFAATALWYDLRFSNTVKQRAEQNIGMSVLPG